MFCRLLQSSSKILPRHFSTTRVKSSNYDFVVAGGGAGGIGSAAALSKVFGKDAKIAIIEPSQTQFYQPLWTLVGAGAVDFEVSARPMESLIPKGCDWLQSKVQTFHPEKNTVVTSDGKEISYKYLVVALGLQLRYDMINGLPESLQLDGIGSNYSIETVRNTWKNLQNFQGGTALFTLPNTPIKCVGAPQKIMYLTDDYLRKVGLREQTDIHFCSALGAIFGVQKYAKELTKICKDRNLNLHFYHNLIAIDGVKKMATFDLLNQDGSSSGETKTMEFDMIHITPPMTTPEALQTADSLVDPNGFLDIHQYTLQHKCFKNVFGLGDCTNTPNGKTAAAVASQLGVLMNNLLAFIEGKPIDAKYDGYTSCPIITRYGKCILAEFDYAAQPLETLPINQAKERYLSYLIKKDALPEIYWSGLMKGAWYGPKPVRKLLHLGLSR